MKTDALYLNLFETTPSLALRLAGYDSERGNEYTCRSGELKRSFRVDVVLTPPPESDLPLILAEVQFHRDTDFYHRIVASYAVACIQQAEEGRGSTDGDFLQKPQRGYRCRYLAAYRGKWSAAGGVSG